MRREISDHWQIVGAETLQTHPGSREGPGTRANNTLTDSSQHSAPGNWEVGPGLGIENLDFHEIRIFLETPIKSDFYDDNNRFTTQLIQTLTP